MFTPAEPTSEDDLVCEVDAQAPDLDDDAITYTFSWLQDGTAYTGADTTTYTGDTILSGDWSEDETWVCLVTPNDGTDDGPQGRIALGVEDPIGVDFTGASVSKTTLHKAVRIQARAMTMPAMTMKCSWDFREP